MQNSLPLERASQFSEQRFSLRRNRTSKVEEHFECGGTYLIEELEAVGGSAVHVTGLFYDEYCGQLLPSDVHVE